MHNNRVYIPFDNYRLLCLFDGIPGHIHCIEDTVFLKQRRLWRIQIFWLTITKCTSAKTDHSTPRIPDGKDQPVPEVIINSTANSCSTATIPDSPVAHHCEAATSQLPL